MSSTPSPIQYMSNRKSGWPVVGWTFRIAAGLAAVVVLLCAFNSIRWINRPFPGFLLWENLFVPAVGDTDWPSYVSDVPFQSRLIAVDGEPVHAAYQVYRHARKVPVGTNIRYTFALPDGSTVNRTVPTMRFTPPEYLWTLGSYILIGALLTLLGFAVYLIRPDAPAARAMLVAGVSWGIYLVTEADILGFAWFRPLWLMAEAVVPISLLHVALTFPVERRVLQRFRWLMPALYGAALVVGVCKNLAFRRWYDSVIFFNHLHAAAVTAGGLVLIALLAQSFFFPPSAAARQRIKIAALGALVAFLSPVVGYLLFYLMGVSIPSNVLVMPLAIFPVAISYAIVKHNLFEVDAIIRRALSWAILTGVIAVVYVGAVGTLELMFAGRSGRVAQLLFLLLIVAVFNPLRGRVQAAIDFLFARDRYDYRRTVAEASQALATLLNLETVVGRILNIITDTIHVEFGAVWLRGRDGQGYQLQAVAGAQPPSLPRDIAGDSALLRRLEERPQRILTEDFIARRGLQSEELARLGSRLLVPMSFERRLVGFLALGQKESGRFYSGEDLELLRTLANQGAVAVENAHSYRALVRANEELRAAQSRLIEAERFAAIGELSASVAHGIRNPLAGIKAAAQFADLDLARDHPLHENIVDIIGEVDKLEGRIKALLDFARPFQPHRAPCRVEDIIADALTSMRSQILSQKVALSTAVEPDLPPAELDYAQIEQVLLALLSNAVEAMPEGGEVTVSARLVEGGREVSIAVADTGPGIPGSQVDPLFKLFFTTKASGTGLGLAVAKKIVELHGGTITARSEVGRGSCFTVRLPLTAPSLAAGAAASEREISPP